MGNAVEWAEVVSNISFISYFGKITCFMVH
jgi:hypothetical protein